MTGPHPPLRGLALVCDGPLASERHMAAVAAAELVAAEVEGVAPPDGRNAQR